MDPISGWLTNFILALEPTVADLRRAWKDYGPFDLIYINSAKPTQVGALALWIKQDFSLNLPPSIVVELGTEAGLNRNYVNGMPVFTVRDPTAMLYRHVTNWVGKKWLRKIRFVAETQAAADEYAFILDQIVQVVPLPQSPPNLRQRKVNACLTVGILGHQRPDKGWQFAPEFIPRVLQANPKVKFIAQQSDVEGMRDVTAQLALLAATEPRLELLVEPAVNDNWFALIDRCDIVALPYDPIRYQTAYSAIVGEALAAGAPVVVPAETTMSSAIDAAGGPGTTFKCWDSASIASAIDFAIGDFDKLAEIAYRAGLGWRKVNGPDHFVAAVIETGSLNGSFGAIRRVATRSVQAGLNALRQTST